MANMWHGHELTGTWCRAQLLITIWSLWPERPYVQKGCKVTLYTSVRCWVCVCAISEAPVTRHPAPSVSTGSLSSALWRCPLAAVPPWGFCQPTPRASPCPSPQNSVQSEQHCLGSCSLSLLLPWLSRGTCLGCQHFEHRDTGLSLLVFCSMWLVVWVLPFCNKYKGWPKVPMRGIV